jgi:hypothetical protein
LSYVLTVPNCIVRPKMDPSIPVASLTLTRAAQILLLRRQSSRHLAAQALEGILWLVIDAEVRQCRFAVYRCRSAQEGRRARAGPIRRVPACRQTTIAPARRSREFGARRSARIFGKPRSWRLVHPQGMAQRRTRASRARSSGTAESPPSRILGRARRSQRQFQFERLQVATQGRLEAAKGPCRLAAVSADAFSV